MPLRLYPVEIVRGLVLHLCPDELRAGGATCQSDYDHPPVDPHFFVCVSVSGGTSTWMPVSSRDAPEAGRQLVAPDAKLGNPKWTTGDSFVVTGQRWQIPFKALEKAAAAGHDLSRPGQRNRIPNFVPTTKPPIPENDTIAATGSGNDSE